MLAWLAETTIGTLIKGVLGAILQGIEKGQQRADQVELGQKRQVTADQVAEIAALRRLQAAQAAPHDAETTLGRLKDGTF